jgi:hypothetical protein
MARDLLLYNNENLAAQLDTAPYRLGFYTLHFYTEAGKPVNRKTDTVEEFYLYPSGGTLRDSSFNIVVYDSRYDTYRGFVPPHRKASKD